MLRKPMPAPRAASRLYDPAKDAARLLGWFGLTILMVGAPLVGVVSRRSLLVLLPVGAAILAAGYLLSVSKVGLRALREAFITPIGLAGLFLAGWAALSLIWTPFPELAIPRLLATGATVFVAALIIAHLPERGLRRNLFLLPAGLAFTAIAVFGLAVAGPSSFRGGTEFDPSLLERSVLTLVVLLWPAVGALSAFARWRSAAALSLLVAASLVAARAQIAMAVFALAAASFALSVERPRRAGLALAVPLGGLVLVGPALPFLLSPLADRVPRVGASTVAAMRDWRDLVIASGPRLITGHGLDQARLGVTTGFLPPHTPRTILFEVWYDLGVLGAVALAALFALALRAAGEAAAPLAPALIAGLVATFGIADFGVATAELWFVSLVSLQAVAFGLVARSGRAGRPVLGTPGADLENGAPDEGSIAGLRP